MSLVSQSLFECELSAIIKVAVQLAAWSWRKKYVLQMGGCMCECMWVYVHVYMCMHTERQELSSLIEAIHKGVFPSEARAGRNKPLRVPLDDAMTTKA